MLAHRYLLLTTLLAACATGRNEPPPAPPREARGLPGIDNPLTLLLADADSMRLTGAQSDSIRTLAEALDRRNAPLLERLARQTQARRREARGRVQPPPTTGPIGGRPDQRWNRRATRQGAPNTRGILRRIDANNAAAMERVKELLDDPQRQRADAVLAAHRLGRRGPSEGPLPDSHRIRSTRTR